MKSKQDFSVACIILLSVFISCGDYPGVEEEMMPLIIGLLGICILITIGIFIKVIIIDSIRKFSEKYKNG